MLEIKSVIIIHFACLSPKALPCLPLLPKKHSHNNTSNFQNVCAPCLHVYFLHTPIYIFSPYKHPIGRPQFPLPILSGVRCIMAPKVIHVLIPGTCEYVTLYGKRDFSDVIKLKSLRWRNFLGLTMWALNVITSVLIRKAKGGASLVAQWLRTCLPMQGTRVRALVWEDPTCHGAAGPVSHNY